MRHLALDPLRGQQAISGLWLGVLVSRACLLAAGSRLGLRAIAGAGVVSMVVTACAVLSGARTVELVFGAIGLAVGAVYPLTMALIGQRFVDARGTATGIAGGAGALGAVVAPWLTGALGDRVGVGLGVASMALWGLLIVVGALNALAHLRKETRT
jgi:MFS family permease